MYNFDASSVIHAWDSYPPENQLFNSLWKWFGEKVQNKEFTISETAFNEVKHKISECGEWLKKNGIKMYDLTPVSTSSAKRFKELLEIVEEQYTTKGVDENDLFIIAVAKEIGATLVTEEGIQGNLPPKKSNYKIPAVCTMPEVNVKCCNFLSLLK